MKKSFSVNSLIIICTLISPLFFSQCANSDDGHYTDNPTAEKFYSKGTQLMQDEQYKEAIEPLTEAIKNDKHFVAAFINRASCYNKLKEYDAALKDAESALQWNSESAYAFYHKALAEQGLKKFTEAADDFEQAAKNYPEEASRYRKKEAECLEAAGQTDKAQRLLKSMTASDDPYAMLSRLDERADKNDFAGAIGDINALIAKNPNFWLAFRYRGTYESRMGNYEKALADYNHALQLEKDCDKCIYFRAWDKFFMGDFKGCGEDALASCRQLESNSNRGNYGVILAVLAYRKMNQPDYANKLLNWWAPYGRSQKWPGPVFKYLRHEISIDDLLKAAKIGDSDKLNDRMTEAKTYIGVCASIDGKSKEAHENLNWVKQQGNKTFSEYQMALSELKRLSK